MPNLPTSRSPGCSPIRSGAAEYVTVAGAIAVGAEIKARTVVIDRTAVPHTVEVEIFNTVCSRVVPTRSGRVPASPDQRQPACMIAT